MTIPHREPQKPSFREASKDALLLVLHPLVRWLSIMRVRPDTLTVIGWTWRSAPPSCSAWDTRGSPVS